MLHQRESHWKNPILPFDCHPIRSGAEVSGLPGVQEALSEKFGKQRLISFQSICTVRIDNSWKSSSRQPDTHNLSVSSGYAPTDSSPDGIKNTFHQKMNDFLRKTEQGHIVILVEGIIARVSQLFLNEANLGSHSGHNSCRSDSGKRAPVLCSDHRFLDHKNFNCSNRRNDTWSPYSSSQRRTQIDQMAISNQQSGWVARLLVVLKHSSRLWTRVNLHQIINVLRWAPDTHSNSAD